MYSENDRENIMIHIDKLADEILEISAGLNDCGEAIACRECSSKLIASAAAIRTAKKKIQA